MNIIDPIWGGAGFFSQTVTPAPTNSKPAEGEATQRQDQLSMWGGAWGSQFSCAGLSPRLPYTYLNFELLLNDPTIQIARAQSLNPILAGSWTLPKADESKIKLSDDDYEAYKANIEKVRFATVEAALWGVDFGWAGFENIWAVEDGRYVLKRCKPLEQRFTTILIDDHGAFAGLKQGDVTLLGHKAWIYTYGGRAGNLHGRSRLINVIDVMADYGIARLLIAQLAKKAGGIVAVVKFPPGEGIDPKTGKNVTRQEQAEALGKTLAGGAGYMVMQNFVGLKLDDIDDVKTLVEMSKGSMWQIERIDLGDAHGAMGANIKEREYLDRLKCRGYLVREREVLEAGRGGLGQGDSKNHGDSGKTTSSLVDQGIANAFNAGPMNSLLFLNGDQPDSLAIKPEPLESAQPEIDGQIIDGLLAQPATAAKIYENYDTDAVLERNGIPKRNTPLPPIIPAESAGGAQDDSVDELPAKISPTMLKAISRVTKDGSRAKKNGKPVAARAG